MEVRVSYLRNRLLSLEYPEAPRRSGAGIIRPFFILVLCLIGLTAGPGALEGKDLPLWEAGLGGAVLVMPDYRGSDETRGYLLPFPYLIYRGEVLKVDRQQIRGLLFQTDRLQLDLSFHGSVPVDSSKNKARQGMPDLDPTVEIGPSLQYLLTENKTAGYKITLTFPLRAVVATDLRNFNAAGWTFSPRLNLNRFNLFQKGWILGLSLGPIFGDQVYHDYYFRVDKAFSTPDRPAYSAAGGYGGTQCTLSLGKHFKKIWMGLFVRGEDLHNTAFSDSPLLKSRTSLMGGLALSWIFWESKTLAAADK